ncbi:DUF2157 domain-containing protein [Methylobacterium sp. A54F]
MPLSYRARLRRDLQRWQERGLILPEQAERIAADALTPRGLGHLQALLALCILLLAAPAIIAFVAANWAAMSPAWRMAVLFLGNAAAVLATYVAARRQAPGSSGPSRGLADGLATLSLVFAAGTLALVGQTFHLPADPRGFAGTVSALGLATALVTRSGGATLIACAALAAADTGILGIGPTGVEALRTGWSGFWLVGPCLFLASLAGWLPAREATLLLLLLVLTNHLGVASSGLPFLVPPDRVLMVAALALALGHGLAAASAGTPATAGAGGWAARLREGGEALSRAAAGLCLVGILIVALHTLGFGGAKPGVMTLPAFAALALAALLLVRHRLDGRGPLPLADLLVLGASGLGLLTWLLAGTVRGPSPILTVWGGIVPALTLVVAGHLEERRGLFGWSLTLCAGLTLGMLAFSHSLITFSGNLLVCALLVAMTLAACRWADRRLIGESA